ncbi:MAG: tryptophan synthase subunit alpha [Bacteroidales bacterium]|nr:tryptophan synthase subunit alpha [Bacteroidales bacterium]
MNRIENLFQNKKNILNIYLTAGYPKLNDTVEIVKELENAGVDMVEIGMPFSDPLADGPVIQHSSTVALKNCMTLNLIFSQIQEIRKSSDIPIIMMGYFNQLMQYGEEAFFEKAAHCGVDGLIIPDLPVEIYSETYNDKVKKLGLDMIFLISPQTENERIRLLDEASSGFLYVVSSASTTGKISNMEQEKSYFERIQKMKLKNPLLIGFGISDKKSYDTACNYASGAIIGSAFIRALEKNGSIKQSVHEFIKTIRP